jgi:voltage-gated potassium channel
MRKHVAQILRAAPAENRVVHRRALRAVSVTVGLIALGTGGYHMIEGWPIFDAFYMTVITVATVGYGETHPLSDLGRAFTVFLIIVGAVNIAYGLAGITEFFAKGGWEEYRRRARMHRELEALRDHTIVCGYGRLGSEVVRTLLDNRAPVVVVEANPAIAERVREQTGVPFVVGDAADDEVLQQAGVANATTLVTALSDDAANVFLTLTARVLNPQIVVYGKADDPTSLIKLERAGAQHVFSPSLVAGHRIAMQIVRPHVTDIVALHADKAGFDLTVEEFEARELVSAVGRPLSETRLWGNEDAMVLAVKTADGHIVFPPRGDYRLGATDRLIVMAKAHAMAQMASGAGAQ